MQVQLTPAQRDRLLQLVDSALLELGPEIHHTMTSTFKEELKEQRRELRALRDLLAGVSSGPADNPAEATGTLGVA